MYTPAFESLDGNITSGKNKSFWAATSEPIIFQKLTQNIENDV